MKFIKLKLQYSWFGSFYSTSKGMGMYRYTNIYIIFTYVPQCTSLFISRFLSRL